jgi:hypothetical protein
MSEIGRSGLGLCKSAFSLVIPSWLYFGKDGQRLAKKNGVASIPSVPKKIDEELEGCVEYTQQRAITMAMAGVGPARSDSSIRDDVQFELKWDPKGSPTEVKENIENALR